MVNRYFNGLSPAVIPLGAFYANLSFNIKSGYDMGSTVFVVNHGRYAVRSTTYTGVADELSAYDTIHEAKVLNDLFPAVSRTKSFGSNYIQPIDIAQTFGAVVDFTTLSFNNSLIETGISGIAQNLLTYNISPGSTTLASMETVLQSLYLNPNAAARFRPINRISGVTSTAFKIILDYTNTNYLSYEVSGATATYRYTTQDFGSSILRAYAHGVSYNTGFSLLNNVISLNAYISNNIFVGAIADGDLGNDGKYIYDVGVSLAPLVRVFGSAGFGSQDAGNSHSLLITRAIVYDMADTSSAYDVIAEGLNHNGTSLYLGNAVNTGISYSPGITNISTGNFLALNGISSYFGYQLIVQKLQTETFLTDAYIEGTSSMTWSIGAITETVQTWLTGIVGDVFGNSFRLITTVDNFNTLISNKPIKTGFGLPAGKHQVRITNDDLSLSIYINKKRIFLQDFISNENKGFIIGGGLSVAGQSINISQIFHQDDDSIDQVLVFPQDVSVARSIQNALPAESFLHYENNIATIEALGQTNSLYQYNLTNSALSSLLKRNLQNVVSVDTIFKNGHINVISGKTDYFYNLYNNSNETIQLRRSLAISDVTKQGINTLNNIATDKNSSSVTISWAPFMSKGEFISAPQEFGISAIFIIKDVRHQLDSNGAATTTLDLGLYETS